MKCTKCNLEFVEGETHLCVVPEDFSKLQSIEQAVADFTSQKPEVLELVRAMEQVQLAYQDACKAVGIPADKLRMIELINLKHQLHYELIYARKVNER